MGSIRIKQSKTGTSSEEIRAVKRVWNSLRMVTLGRKEIPTDNRIEMTGVTTWQRFRSRYLYLEEDHIDPFLEIGHFSLSNESDHYMLHI